MSKSRFLVLEDEELKRNLLILELELGEQSSIIKDFNPKDFLTLLHQRMDIENRLGE